MSHETPPEIPGKRRRRTRMWISFGAWLLLLIVIWRAVLWVAQLASVPWPEPVKDVVLNPPGPRPEVDDITPDNAFFYILRMTNRVDVKSMEKVKEEFSRLVCLGLSTNRFEELPGWVSSHSNTFDLMRQAAKVEEARSPSNYDYEHVYLYVGPLSSAGKTVPFYVLQHASTQNWEAVTARFQASLKTADHLTRGTAPATVLTAYSMTSLSLMSMRRILLEQDVPAEVLNQWAVRLDRLDAEVEPLTTAFQVEYVAMTNFVEDVYDDATIFAEFGQAQTAAKPGVFDGLFKWWYRFLWALGDSRRNKTRRHLEAVLSHLIHDASQPWSPTPNPMIEPLLDSNFGTHPQHFFDDPVGRMLLFAYFSATTYTDVYFRQHRTNLGGTRLMIAIRRFQADHENEPPDRLDQLIPDYIESLPPDPFSTNAADFVYAREAGSWRLYSLGPDAEDNQGRTNAMYTIKESEGKDIVFGPDELEMMKQDYLEDAEKN
ncbi:MAG: hypothetical protein AAF492_09405 [Verrucomicrobiota bacterium]